METGVQQGWVGSEGKAGGGGGLTFEWLLFL